MATVLPAEQPTFNRLKRHEVEGPISRSLIRRICCTGDFRTITLLSGDVMFAGHSISTPRNMFAEFLSKQEIRGDVILCSPEEIA